MPTDKAMAEFCFSMLKQLDLKAIDWNAVASDQNITNGHAARMRYFRFKAQMEGVPQTADQAGAPKRPRGRPPGSKNKTAVQGPLEKKAGSKKRSADEMADEERVDKKVKLEPYPPPAVVKREGGWAGMKSEGGGESEGCIDDVPEMAEGADGVTSGTVEEAASMVKVEPSDQEQCKVEGDELGAAAETSTP
ncbi:hypothetical protein BJ546DRAFT_196034 [Cryomyces antarcticus]|uniref:Myb-like DNA-binding domain-containing protein n=1 Tax=Cryomyces antarcticus TaxID=329879 RepID=A0ABR0LN97_9PEZI|nr:hypothetical protein LTR39_003578 [Cryomyces antarcticus]KAK5014079.1 hypothetical protein LTR60_003544 [Cryomyces antarcticus]KAK5155310.1 hypothetical protein LTR04_005858 [Oleoguttula sp. CCFEE 6159]KAK5200982.1 hypothetical protein LTR16_004230 [Cryomyces antarcticus]